MQHVVLQCWLLLPCPAGLLVLDCSRHEDAPHANVVHMSLLGKCRHTRQHAPQLLDRLLVVAVQDGQHTLAI